jgi:hypothetical protein
MRISSLYRNLNQFPIIAILIAILLGIVILVHPFGIYIVSLGIAGLVGSWVIFFRPYWVILFLVMYMPMENLVLKFAPISDQIYFYASFFSEILIYLSFLAMVIRKIFRREKFFGSPIDKYLIAFLIFTGLSIIINQSPLFGSLINVRALLRYTFLFYLVVNLNFDEQRVKRILSLIIFVGIFEILIGLLQLSFGNVINPILLPRQTDIEIAGISRGFVLLQRGRELGAIFGSLGDTIYFGLFMLIVMAVYLGRIEKIKIIHLLPLLAIFLAINFSYARAVVFAVFLLILVYYRVHAGKYRTMSRLLFLSIGGFLVLTLFLNSSTIYDKFTNPLKLQQNIISNLTGIFNIDYFYRAQNQRLGALMNVPPIVIANSPLVGFGPDEETTIEKINQGRQNVSFVSERYKAKKNGFEDVYWVALLAYYGFIGLGIVVLLLIKLYSSMLRIYQRTELRLTKNLAIVGICLTSVTILLLFFYRVLEFRIFSFYFWLLLGLLFGLYNLEQTSIIADDESQEISAEG